MHTIRNPYMAAEQDREPPQRMTVCYVLATVPRSGSTFLGRALWDTELAGVPSEYLNVQNMKDLFSRWGALTPKGVARRLVKGSAIGPRGGTWRSMSLEAYFKKLLLTRSTPNGVFGIKAHYEQLDSLIFQKGHALEDFLAPLRYIFVERQDRLRQAISLVRAQQTSAWDHLELSTGQPRYDEAAIGAAAERIKQQERLWLRYFEKNQIEPLKVVYEHFAENYEETVLSALSFLGVEAAGVAVKPPTMQRQADAMTEEWVRRYHEEVGSL